MASDEWHLAQRSIRAMARRYGPRRLRQEIVDEAELRLLERAMRGGVIACWVAYAAQLTRSIVRQLRRSELVALDDEVAAPPPRWSFDQLVDGEPLPGGMLRGARQKRLLAAIVDGQSCVAIGSAWHVPEKEVRRQVRKLEAVVLGCWKISGRTSTAGLSSGGSDHSIADERSPRLGGRG